MDEKRQSDIFRRAIEKYGINHQVVKALEEMAELQTEICRYGDKRTSVDKIAEEMADTLIVLFQLVQYLNLKEVLKKMYNWKLEALEERLSG